MRVGNLIGSVVTLSPPSTGLAEANAEVQPPVNNEQPSLLVHDPEGYLRPDRHKGMKSSIQM